MVGSLRKRYGVTTEEHIALRIALLSAAVTRLEGAAMLLRAAEEDLLAAQIEDPLDPNEVAKAEGEPKTESAGPLYYRAAGVR
jgi:hypothetical protein